jgi:hypothetical protein
MAKDRPRLNMFGRQRLVRRIAADSWPVMRPVTTREKQGSDEASSFAE